MKECKEYVYIVTVFNPIANIFDVNVFDSKDKAVLKIKEIRNECEKYKKDGRIKTFYQNKIDSIELIEREIE